MSYILAALRKAERDRQALQSHRIEDFISGAAENFPAAVRANRLRVLALAAAAALTVAGVAGYYWLSGERQSGNEGQRASPTPAVATVASAAVTDTPAAQPPATGVSQSEPRATVPDLNITGYIYFETKPQRSKLFVDGSVFRLRDELRPGMRLLEFQADRVIVHWRGTRLEVPIP